MTKVEAIEQVLKDNGGSASLRIIYDKIEKYHPKIKSSMVWESALRGVLYRELSNGVKF